MGKRIWRGETLGGSLNIKKTLEVGAKSEYQNLKKKLLVVVLQSSNSCKDLSAAFRNTLPFPYNVYYSIQVMRMGFLIKSFNNGCCNDFSFQMSLELWVTLKTHPCHLRPSMTSDWSRFSLMRPVPWGGEPRSSMTVTCRRSNPQSDFW